MMRTNSDHPSSGQIILIVTLALPILLGAMALCMDLGVFYFNWLQLQKAADAAVLAGANYLPLQPAQAVSIANNYAETNGVRAAEILSDRVAADDLSISISLKRDVPYFFGRVLGFTSAPVSVQSTAGVQAVGTAGGVAPLGLDALNPITPGQEVTLKLNRTGRGGWSPLHFGDDWGPSAFRQNLEHGSSGSVSAGQQVPAERGDLTAAAYAGLLSRIDQGLAQNPLATWSNHPLNDPRVITVPVINSSAANGQLQAVLGFAELWLTGVSNNGTASAIFIAQTAGNSQRTPNAPNFGALVPVLLN